MFDLEPGKKPFEQSFVSVDTITEPNRGIHAASA
jgi:hypothetical protein